MPLGRGATYQGFTARLVVRQGLIGGCESAACNGGFRVGRIEFPPHCPRHLSVPHSCQSKIITTIFIFTPPPFPPPLSPLFKRALSPLRWGWHPPVQWHLGTLSDRGIGSPDCYKKAVDGQDCQQGYWERDGGCCFGVDGKLNVSNPFHFGFDEFVATPECAASATTNCGCFFFPSPHNDTPCEVGHYRNGGTVSPPYLECMQYYRGNLMADGVLSVEPLDYVTPVDDERFLVDQLEGLMLRSKREGKPFLAAVFFHGAHIPDVATPATRARYAALGLDENHQVFS